MSTESAAPLRFEPLFRRYLWGGRRLATLLNKPLGEGDDYAESWEIVDHGADQIVVRGGALAGRTLQQLIHERPEWLLGAGVEVEGAQGPRFPLLFKFLDCNHTLSVQVHPNDAQGALLDPPDLGKTEAWVVVSADAGSRLYAGLRDGVTRQQLADALAEGSCAECLHEVPVSAGDCVFIPAGTVHALGAGLVIAEIQQASDTTFRLFDWNRLDKEGRPRDLHIEQSLAVIDFQRGPVGPVSPQATDDPRCELLVACDKFVLRRWKVCEPLETPDRGTFRILAVLEGALDLIGDPLAQPLARGETAVLPAALRSQSVNPHGQTTFLEIALA
ncbi:MAG: class I mannose-6-phosphate isomerase [Planctomycetales bacterium]|nr:class I mannose-6-phosphate isomerase [Planctomycetales bacterium]